MNTPHTGEIIMDITKYLPAAIERVRMILAQDRFDAKHLDADPRRFHKDVLLRERLEGILECKLKMAERLAIEGRA